MQHFPKIIAALVCFASLPSVALADYTSAATSNGGSMRIASLPVDGDGNLQALLEIDLKPGWITYWREPGASGIPPQIALLSADQGTVKDIRYPVPKRLMLGDYLDIAYDAPVKIPFTISLSDAKRKTPVQISIMVGVCKEICIPFQHEFTLDPAAGTKVVEISRLFGSALQTLPEAPSADFKVDNFAISKDKTAIDLALTVPKGTSTIEQVVIAGPPGQAYTQVTDLTFEGQKAKFTVDASSLPKTFDPSGQQWHLVVSAGGRSMESTLDFDAP